MAGVIEWVYIYYWWGFGYVIVFGELVVGYFLLGFCYGVLYCYFIINGNFEVVEIYGVKIFMVD